LHRTAGEIAEFLRRGILPSEIWSHCFAKVGLPVFGVLRVENASEVATYGGKCLALKEFAIITI
jgi:hypothetical protein